MSLTDEALRAALNRIYDPCSVAAGRPLGLSDMGLLWSWRLESGKLEVTFCATFTGCTLAPHFMEAAKAELQRLPGVERVIVRLDSSRVWTRDRMRNAAPPPEAPPGVQPWALRHSSAKNASQA